MSDQPNSHESHYRPGPIDFDDQFPPELQPLVQRLSADGSLWLSQLADPAKVADRIRAIPSTQPRPINESELTVSTQINVPPARGADARQPDARPPRSAPQGGLLAALVAALVVALIALVFVQLAQRAGVTTGPVGRPTPTQTLPTATQPAPTATSTTPPTGSWTTIQAYTAGGDYTTSSFEVKSPWRITWQCNLSMGNVSSYPINVAASPASDPGAAAPVLDVECQAGATNGTSAEITAPTGSVYLIVTSVAESEWDLRIQVLR